jgi:glycerol uptake facilitator-like aquaporin
MRAGATLQLPRVPAGVGTMQELYVQAVLAFAYVLVVLNVSCRRPRQVRFPAASPRDERRLGWLGVACLYTPSRVPLPWGATCSRQLHLLTRVPRVQVEHPATAQGIAVGLLFFAVVSVSVPYAGSSLNPALDTALPLVSWWLRHTEAGTDVLRDVWVFWAGPMMGALVAAVFFDASMM